MQKSLDLLKISAMANGIESIHTPELPEWFKKDFHEILSHPRGAGYWLWKPWVIWDAMEEPADIVIYCDAGIEIINSFDHLINSMEGDIMLFGNHYQHRHWCKREVFDSMGAKDGFQVQASAMVVRVCDWSYRFLDEWLWWCKRPGYIDDSTWIRQYPEFQEHRHDQAILTCLQQRHNLKLHWWPAVYNNGAFTYDKGTYTDTYPPIFHHHRKRDYEW